LARLNPQNRACAARFPDAVQKELAVTRYSAVVLALLTVGTAHAAEKTLERTFTVSPGGSLVVDADSASVHVSGSASNQVTVHISAHGSDDDLAATTLEAVQKDDGVTVTMRRRGNGSGFWHKSWNGDARIEVTVPQQYGIDVHTSGGDVALTGTTGSASLRTSGGDISAKNVNGRVEAKTSGGEIRVDTIRGDVDANTSGGNVRLMAVDGKIRGQTSGGDMECSLTGVNRGILLTTSGGSIRLTLPRATTASFEAATSGGSFSSELAMLTSEQRDGYARGIVNGGGQPINVRTSGGDISLRSSN
jgi:DUF4097 and DUF4098 domain-containing protein YvlB